MNDRSDYMIETRSARSERVALWALAGFVLLALAGYTVFGLHPALLQKTPGAAAIYGPAFIWFAQIQIWLTAAVLFVVLWRRSGTMWLKAFVALYATSLSSELAGTTWGIPFGSYRYTELLGWAWLDRVPAVIPLSWFTIAIPAYALSNQWSRGHRAATVLGTAAWVTLWDLTLDPAMSHLTSYWVWGESGPFYGMPWVNLVGWFVTAAALAGILAALRAERWLVRVPAGWRNGYMAVQFLLPAGMCLAAGIWPAVAAQVAAAVVTTLMLLTVGRRRVAAARGLAQRRAIRTPSSGHTDLAEATALVRRELEAALARVRPDDGPEIRFEGQLLRPLAAYAVADAMGARTDAAFWDAALAVQLAHEASLIHDDVIDSAATRRGRATVFAERGVAAALVEGDHLLTLAYQAAARSGLAAWFPVFTHAVERTVAGEIRGARSVGKRLSREQLEDIAIGKSGELFGAAMAIAPLMVGADPEPYRQLGLKFGLAYQMLDDLLDLCPAVDTGKPALADLTQGKWTWAMAYLPEGLVALSPQAAAAELRRGDALSARVQAAEAYVAHAENLRRELRSELGHAGLLDRTLSGWQARALSAAEARADALSTARLKLRVAATPALARGDTAGYFAANARSFRFAARWFPRAVREQVVRLYAYLRFADDLADDPALPVVERLELLDAWRDLSRAAHAGVASGIPMLDHPMQDAARAGVPWRDIAAVLEGFHLDLSGTTYADSQALRSYTYAVAGAVGRWLTQLLGIRDPWILERAEALGHAMQLTNIVRDVGEDLRQGRLYLPADLLAAHGLAQADLEAMAAGAPVTAAYRAVLADLMAQAEREYAKAFAAMPYLPGWYARPVAVAASVYAGIHAALRRNGYDNFSRRATVSFARKLVLAWAGLKRLQQNRRREAAMVRPPQLQKASSATSVVATSKLS